MERKNRFLSINRSNIIKNLMKLASVSALIVSYGCSISTISSPPTPSGYEIPTTSPLDTSPFADLKRFYPHLENLSNNYKVERLNTEIPTNIHNFTLNRKIDSDEATKVFSFYDEYVNQNISFPYRFLLSFNATLSVTRVMPWVWPGFGQAANSQLGRVLPTALPSGQSFASAVQATGC